MSEEYTDQPIQESVSSEVESPEPEITDEEPQLESGQDETGEEEAVEAEEVEYEGKKYVLPKGLKAALLRQSDYTRKTQEVAEQRKAIESEREQVKRAAEAEMQRVQAAKAHIQAYSHMAALDSQLEEYGKTDWASLSDNDPVEAQKRFFQFSQLKEQRNQLAGYIAQQEQQQAFQSQQEFAKRREEGLEVLKREIKDWSDDKAKSLREFAISQGAQASTVDSILDPGLVKVMHKAMLYDQLMQKAQTKPKQTADVKPAVTVSGPAKVQKDPDKMSTAEWVKWREAQLRKKQSR